MQDTDKEELNFFIGEDSFDVLPFYESQGITFDDLKRYEISI